MTDPKRDEYVKRAYEIHGVYTEDEQICTTRVGAMINDLIVSLMETYPLPPEYSADINKGMRELFNRNEKSADYHQTCHENVFVVSMMRMLMLQLKIVLNLSIIPAFSEFQRQYYAYIIGTNDDQ